MTHVDEDFLRMPAHLALKPADSPEPGKAIEVRLLVQGQGTVAFALERMERFAVSIESDAWSRAAFRWDIEFDRATLFERVNGEWVERSSADGVGLDLEPTCTYWFSFDYHNRALRYGKGEMRLGTMLASHDLDPKPADAPDPYAWLGEATRVSLAAPTHGVVDVWRDPVTVDPPMRVISHDEITMDDVAQGRVTVPGNLTATCQLLYDNVAGAAFRLDTPDFLDFAEAIKRSIEDENGWCYKTLKAKASEFGTYDPLATYLRITLGQNQGESPGIPFVMEIWPSGHYSPIHNHGYSDAVIKVLHGEIAVSLYSMLSLHHEAPFAVDRFRAGEVTWISARLNQVHKLMNEASDPCITIQCYMYAETNLTHWPYFDYLEKSDIAHFDPNSDADFAAFKAIIKKEWEQRPQ